MRALVGLLVALAPVVAHAKTFNDSKGGTWDCKTDATITINGNGGTYAFDGPCKVITVNGNHNKLHVRTVDIVMINGNGTFAVFQTLDRTLTINGNDNRVEYNGRYPTTNNAGKRNTIRGPQWPKLI